MYSGVFQNLGSMLKATPHLLKYRKYFFTTFYFISRNFIIIVNYEFLLSTILKSGTSLVKLTFIRLVCFCCQIGSEINFDQLRMGVGLI